MLKRYGEKAFEESSTRADVLAADGDQDGASTWRRITVAVKQLANNVPPSLLHWSNGPERSSHRPRHYSSISPDPSDEKSGGYTSTPRLKLAPLSTEPFIHDAPDLWPVHAAQAQAPQRAGISRKVLPGHASDDLDQRVHRRRLHPAALPKALIGMRPVGTSSVMNL
jgi:hypothetical protein